jgi:hypothetical protein
MSLETPHHLATDELDIAFVIGSTDLSGHNARTLWRESAYAALSQGHRLVPGPHAVH